MEALTELDLVLRSCNQAVIVGISGVTCSGKSSLVNMFSKCIGSIKTVCQDDYYFTCEDFIVGTECTYPNFDSIRSVDMDSFMKQVCSLKSEILSNPDTYCKLIILDGFSLFNHEALAGMCHLKYFITLSYEECLGRRRRRNRSPPEPVGYFERVAWPMYISNLQDMSRTALSKDVKFLDGNDTSDEHFCKILQDIMDHVRK